MTGILSLRVAETKPHPFSAMLMKSSTSGISAVNRKQYTIIMQGAKYWNDWLKGHPGTKIDLSKADLNNIDLSGYNLVQANLRGASLNGADLSFAILDGANFSGASLVHTYLIRSHLTQTNFHQANLERAILSFADLSYANLDSANLKEAICSEANFRNASFSHAILQMTQMIGSNLTSASLTGACIENWHINQGTMLESVICDYVYLEAKIVESDQKYPPMLRRRVPKNSNRFFRPGEFMTLLQSLEQYAEKFQTNCFQDQVTPTAFAKKLVTDFGYSYAKQLTQALNQILQEENYSCNPNHSSEATQCQRWQSSHHQDIKPDILEQLKGN